MTTHELARVLLSAPDAPAKALAEDHGSSYWIDLEALVVSEDEIEYMGLRDADPNTKPGDAVITADA